MPQFRDFLARFRPVGSPEARRAHQAALEAAAAHAAAVRLIEAEVTVTRSRLRAIRDRWIPRLEQARAEMTFALDELERADQARLRLATDAPATGLPDHG